MTRTRTYVAEEEGITDYEADQRIRDVIVRTMRQLRYAVQRRVAEDVVVILQEGRRQLREVAAAARLPAHLIINQGMIEMRNFIVSFFMRNQARDELALPGNFVEDHATTVFMRNLVRYLQDQVDYAIQGAHSSMDARASELIDFFENQIESMAMIEPPVTSVLSGPVFILPPIGSQSNLGDMSNTSFSNTLSAVDLGTVIVPGVASRQRVDAQRLGPQMTVSYGCQNVYWSVENKRSYHIHNGFSLNGAGLTVRAGQGSVGVASDSLAFLDIDDMTTYTQQPGFNQVWFNEWRRYKDAIPTSRARATGLTGIANYNDQPSNDDSIKGLFEIPDAAYAHSAATNGPYNQGAPTAGIMFTEQTVMLRMKNVTSHSSSNPSSSPLYLDIYVCRYTEDQYPTPVHDQINNPGVLNDESAINGYTQSAFDLGFRHKYSDWYLETDGGDASIKGNSYLQDSNDQDLSITLKDNAFFDTDATVVRKKSICLATGQEAALKITLPSHQFMSYGYRDRAKYSGHCDLGSTVALYLPIIHRKGEYFIMFALHGGVHVSTSAPNGDATRATLQPATLAVFTTCKVRYRMVQPVTKVPKIHDGKVHLAQDVEDADVDV